MTDPLISTRELAALIGMPDLRVVDASWFLDGRDAKAAFREAHAPGAMFFDIDAVCDRSSPLPHMLPSPGAFAEAAGRIGIGEVLAALEAAPETRFARMSGSGATCFALCRDRAGAQGLAVRLEAARPGWWIQPCRLGGPWAEARALLGQAGSPDPMKML